MMKYKCSAKLSWRFFLLAVVALVHGQFLRDTHAEHVGGMLDFDKLASVTRQKILPSINLSNQHLEGLHWPQAAIIPNNGYIYSTIDCDKKLDICIPHVVYLTRENTDPMAPSSRDLALRFQPSHKHSTFKFLDPILIDINGDQKQEYLTRYVVSLPPRSERGSLYYQYFSIVSLPDFREIFFHEVAHCGQSLSDECCKFSFRTQDINKDGFVDLLVSGKCQPEECTRKNYNPHCLDEKPRLIKEETFYYDSVMGQYATVPPSGSVPNVTAKTDVATAPTHPDMAMTPDMAMIPDMSMKQKSPPPIPSQFPAGLLVVALAIVALIIGWIVNRLR